MREKGKKGMTLIEILVVLMIIGSLISISYPMYQNYIKESHRKQAILDLRKIQIKLEQTYYFGYQIEEIFINGDIINEECSGRICSSDPERYQFDIFVSNDLESYTIQATPKKKYNQHTDHCKGFIYNALTLNNTGVTSPEECW